MSRGQEIAALLAALESALADLEVCAGWQPSALVVGLLARRRHSVRVLRRVVRATAPHALAPVTARPASRPYLPGMILAEDMLADRLDSLLAPMSKDDDFRPIIESLRAEADDMARVLRLMASLGSSRD